MFGRIILVLLAVVLIGGGFWMAVDSLSRAAVFSSGGYVAHGSKFGIAIGDPRAKAMAHARSLGLRLEDSNQGGRCVAREYGPEVVLDVFADESWRRGVVCIASRRDRVEEVEWHFAPVDF